MTVCLLIRAKKALYHHLSSTTHRNKITLFFSLAMALSLSLLAAGPAMGGAPAFFSVQPGTANKAVVDLTLGEPVAKLRQRGRICFIDL